jgi:hypothetical protein
VIASALSFQVKGPVGIEVLGRADGAELEHGLRSGEGPAGSGSVHAVFDDVPAGSLDDARCDGEPLAQRVLVAEQASPGAVREVIAGLVDRGVGSSVERLVACFPPADGLGEVAAAATAEEREQAILDPLFGPAVAFAEESSRGIPNVFDDMNDVGEDRDLRARESESRSIGRPICRWVPIWGSTGSC